MTRAAVAKPRVMYVLPHYPAVSHTYEFTEMSALLPDYELRVMSKFELPEAIRHKSPVLPAMHLPDQPRMVEAVAEFWPKVVHTHYLVNLPLVAQLARKTGVPFTLRTHSFDVIPSPSRPLSEERLRELAVLVEDDLCLGVLCFPCVRPELERLGFRPDKLQDCYPVVDYALFYDPSPNGEAVMNVGAGIAKKAMHQFVALASQVKGLTFNLYMSRQDEAEFRRIEALNRISPNPVRLCPWVDHIEMPRQYKKHRWLVYTASREHGNVGWPMAIAEAQAAGVGVCMANIRPDLRTYVGEAGILYDSIQELADIVTKPPPEEMRAAGFEQARKSDIQRHKGMLTALWHRTEPANASSHAAR